MARNAAASTRTPSSWPSSRLGRHRRLVAVAAALVLLPTATVILHPGRPIVSLQTILLIYLLIAVIVAFVGGAVPGVCAAIVGFLLANWYFTSPFRTWTVDDPENVVGLVVFLLVATSVGWLVGFARRRAEDAMRAKNHVEALAASASALDVTAGFDSLVAKIAGVFGADSVALHEQTEKGWEVRACAGREPSTDPTTAAEAVPIDDRRLLTLEGVRLSVEDRRVLAVFAAQAGDALERELLRREAARVEAMAETDRLRAALLGAVSHDLRTPLASIKASVTSLVETGIDWTPDQTMGFLGTIKDEAERLNRLVGQLLDAGRVQAGAVQVDRRAVSTEEVVSAAIASLSNVTSRIEVDVDESLPLIDSDSVLLERAIANLVDNALSYSPEPETVLVRAIEKTGRVVIEIVDHGPGIAPHLREVVLQPFHRLDDSRASSGVGLGLWVTRGLLEALGIALDISDTPAGGTTVRIEVPVWGDT